MRRPGLPTIAARVAAALVCVALATGALDLRGAGRVAVPAGARAEEGDWFAEFEAVCSRTQDAMSLSTDELRALLARCDRLKPRIDGLDPSRRKVYTRRLQLCRDLFRFVLDSRERS